MTTYTKQVSQAEIEELQYSEEYANYIMNHCDSDRVICNANSLTVAMEDGYLFNEFLTFNKITSWE